MYRYHSKFCGPKVHTVQWVPLRKEYTIISTVSLVAQLFVTPWNNKYRIRNKSKYIFRMRKRITLYYAFCKGGKCHKYHRIRKKQFHELTNIFLYFYSLHFKTAYILFFSSYDNNFILFSPDRMAFPCGSAGKESACNVGDLGSILGLGRSPGEGKDYPLQYSDLENSMDCIVHGSQRVGHD